MSEYISLANVKMYYRKADVLCAEADLYEQEADMYSAEKGFGKKFNIILKLWSNYIDK